MKRFLAALLAVCMCVSFAGCGLLDGFDYMKAMDLYEEGSYGDALAIFTELTDYADSQTMAALCKQKVDYAEAERLFAAADYRPALELYTSLMLYEDSPMKAVQCQYAIAAECVEAGNYEEAVSWYDALGGYEDSPEKLWQAKWQWLYTCVEESGGTIEYPLNGDGGEKLYLSCGGDNTLLLTYLTEGYLLAVPFKDELVITLARDSREASYTAYCSSAVASKIEEEAAGVIALADFAAGGDLAVDSFRQTISVESLAGEEPAEPSVTEDLAQAVLMKGMLTAAQAAVAANLPAMLESTGVAVTARELGFLAIE